VQEYNGKTGDLDGDTEITAKDATLVLKIAAGTVTDYNDAIADVDGDGSVTAKDATMILKYAAGSITTFPADSE
jgi:hypothetical protein